MPHAGRLVSSPKPTKIYYDASLILRSGLERPVGLLRADQYVAEFLTADPALDVRFLIYDSGCAGFRPTTASEQALVTQILFRRYHASNEPPAAAVPPPAPSETRREPPPVTTCMLLRQFHPAATVSEIEFEAALIRYAARMLPILPTHGVPRRLATRLARRGGLLIARRCFRVAHAVQRMVARLRTAGRHLARSDTAAAPPQPPVSPSAAPPIECPPTPLPGLVLFERGSVLLSMGNAWDYLDYAYLHRICRDHGVRFISVLYDVAAMDLPFTTPGPLHVYHRHWVEIGHCAAHLLAISQFSMAQYSAFIGEPNDVRPPMSHAYLPNFLHARQAEIGERPVMPLLGRRFVLFCSTIEPRKNHQLLLHLWERLRRELPAAQLPVLVFVGRWGWGTEAVRLLSERNFRLRGHLLILDDVSDPELIWLYRHALFSLFPAFSEGYGLGAAESLSFGTPVVIADCPALVEATEGLMPRHDPLDFTGWLDDLRDIIGNERRLAELRAAAARYRGPAYEGFALALRALACDVAVPAA